MFRCPIRIFFYHAKRTLHQSLAMFYLVVISSLTRLLQIMVIHLQFHSTLNFEAITGKFGYRLDLPPFHSQKTENQLVCSDLCDDEEECQSFNYIISTRECQLLNTSQYFDKSLLIHVSNVFYATSLYHPCVVEPYPCLNGGTCSADGISSVVCNCVPGYTSSNCSIDIDECASDPCRNGATCTDLINAFSCTCIIGYTGKTCDEGRLYFTCNELFQHHSYLKNNYYPLNVSGKFSEIYCDMENYGGGWSLVTSISDKSNDHLNCSENCQSSRRCVEYHGTKGESVVVQKRSDLEIKTLANSEGVFRIDVLAKPLYTAFYKIPKGVQYYTSSCTGIKCPRIIISYSHPFSWESNCKGTDIGYHIYNGGCHKVFDSYDDLECGSIFIASQSASKRVLYGYCYTRGIYENLSGYMFVR